MTASEQPSQKTWRRIFYFTIGMKSVDGIIDVVGGIVMIVAAQEKISLQPMEVTLRFPTK